MPAFANVELHHQWIGFDESKRTHTGEKIVSKETLRELIAANTNKKLYEFAISWFPFMDYWKSWKNPDVNEEVKAVEDTRNLMLLVLKLKQLIDNNECSRASFEELGIIFSQGGTEKHESAKLHYLVSSKSFANYIRGTTNSRMIEETILARFGKDEETKRYFKDEGYLKGDGSFFCEAAPLSYADGELILKEHLYLPNQRDLAYSLHPNERYPVMNFFGGNLTKQTSEADKRAFFFIDNIIGYCIQGIRIETRKGVLVPKATTNFISLWLCLSESFRDSRITLCKTCNLPIIVDKERGTKRLYCNDNCKRKYKRALKFSSLVNTNGLDFHKAAKISGIAASTATRILEHNGIPVNTKE